MSGTSRNLQLSVRCAYGKVPREGVPEEEAGEAQVKRILHHLQF